MSKPDGQVYLTRVWVLFILAVLATPFVIAYEKAAVFLHWFFTVGICWLVLIALCWHLISALAVNKVESSEQHEAVKNGCLAMAENNPNVFEWDGRQCVYPGGK